MKKYLLFITIGMMCCAGVMAETWTPVKTTQMNPFAYNLSAELSADQTTLTVKYCLNADVTSLNIVIKKGGQEYTYPVTENSKLKKTKATDPSQPYDPYLSSNTASHVVDIPTSELASTLGTGTFEWRIEVKGAGRANCGVYSLDGTNVYRHKFYRPSSVDIVQDPTSFNYGKVLVVESQHTVSSKTGYHSSPMTKTKGTAAGNTDPQGAGVYVFNPDLTPRENTSGTYVFNGKSDSRFANTSFSPHRVRVSEDGRMFVTSMDHTKGAILWEINDYFSTWTTVMGKGVGGATYSTSTYDLTTSGGAFIAGPNAGFDVKGSGSELTLLMLSCDYTAINANNQTGFECREYKLGTDTTWSSAAGKNFNTNSRIFVDHCNSNVQYDENGGIWCVSYRENCINNEPGLVHKTSAGTEDCRILRSYTKNAALRFNKTFTRAMMASEGNYGVLYDYIPNHGSNTASQGYFFTQRNIDMSAVGAFLNDFAWDNANNIYAVGQNDGVNGGNGHLVVYCLPYNANDVFTTPGPSDFTISCKEGLTYTVTTAVNNPAMGSVTGGGTIQSCEPITLTATPNEQYRFVNWTVGGKVVSEANPYTFIVTQNVEVTANFAPAVFNVTWWNLFQGGEDISDCPNLAGTNERLWRLFQIEYNHYLRDILTKGEQRGPIQNNIGIANNQWMVYSFLRKGNNSAGTADATLFTYIETFLDDENLNSAFYWLGQYIEACPEKNEISQGTNWSENNWGWYLQAFINRLNYFSNSEGNTLAVESYNGYKTKGFDTYGLPNHWRPKWTRHTCGLNETMNYTDEMPITWTKNACSSGEIKTFDSNWKLYTIVKNPAEEWYKWNTGKLNQLLAWREGDSITGPIVHQVDHDMALYATYVDRHISEVKDNTDVIRLMQNSGYASTPHSLTVDRKLQAGMYNTICFPFTVYINDQTDNGVPHSGLAENHPLKGATVLNLIGTDKLYDESGDPVVVLNFEQVNKLEAGKPYLIQLAEDQPSITEPIPFTGVAYDDLTYINGHQTITTDDGTISFHGMINPGVVTVAADAPTLILVDQNRLALVSQNGEMKGLRGYFTLSPEMASVASNGRCYLSISKPAPTDVEVLTDPQPKARQQVQKIMRNGQIFIIRDGETYTITGQKVR